VGEDAHVRLGPGDVGEGEAAEDVQPVLALGCVAPQRPPHERVNAVGAHEDVVLGGAAVGEVQRDGSLVLLDPVDPLVEAQHVGRDGGEHPLVELRAQQADEAAAVRTLHVRVELHAHPDVAPQVPELRLGRRAEVRGVHPERGEGLQRRWPQVEDVPGRPGLPVALVHDDVVTGLEQAQGGGHAGRAGAEDGDPTTTGGGRR
jgi:hypothetical protein